MTGLKDEAISGSDDSNTSAIENARVMKDHGHPLSGNSINEPHKSINTVSNMQATNNLQEEITHEKHATIEEPTVNLELTKGPLTCPWRNTSPNFFLKGEAAHNGMWRGMRYRKNYMNGEKYSTWVELERRLSYDTFTCFPRLPLELRRKIWLHALPDPRTISLHLTINFYTGREWSEDLKSLLITATLSFDDDSRADLSPDYLLWTCRESSEVFLKHYHRPRGVRPVDNEYHRQYGTRRASSVRVQSEGWIDFEVDTLVAENIECTFYTLAWIQSRVDLSAITNLAISKSPLYGSLDDSWWTNSVPLFIREQFPRLRRFKRWVSNKATRTLEVVTFSIDSIRESIVSALIGCKQLIDGGLK